MAAAEVLGLEPASLQVRRKHEAAQAPPGLPVGAPLSCPQAAVRGQRLLRMGTWVSLVLWRGRWTSTPV